MVRSAITPAAFAKWLGSKNPNDPVGRGWEPTSCPLATYLQERLGRDDIEVRDDKIVVGAERERLRPWARSFGEIVDMSHPGQRVVTAREAWASFVLATDLWEMEEIPAWTHKTWLYGELRRWRWEEF